MKRITKAYIILISIFGIVLVVGSIKSTLYPNEDISTYLEASLYQHQSVNQAPTNCAP